ncbi:MAG: hypothetical protein GXO99_00915 [Nitrospirae bacterium]|nr:hypothetical protein [Nitrospirota bacterium]
MNRIVAAILTVLLILLASCSKKDGEKAERAGTTRAVQSSFRLEPETATINSKIRLITDVPVKEEEIIWLVNGIEVDNKGWSLDTSTLSKTDTVQAVVKSNDKTYYTNVVKIVNSPPVITYAGIEPRFPKKGDSLRAKVKVQDPDNDDVTILYKWFLNGQLKSNESYLDTETERGDQIKLIVTPYDGQDYGERVVVKTMIYNSTPKIIDEGSPEFDGQLYRYKINAYDPDGDRLIYRIIKGPEGMKIADNGVVIWTVPEDFSGTVPVQIEIDDKNGGKALYSFSLTIER